jgi:hypothetical protein
MKGNMIDKIEVVKDKNQLRVTHTDMASEDCLLQGGRCGAVLAFDLDAAKKLTGLDDDDFELEDFDEVRDEIGDRANMSLFCFLSGNLTAKTIRRGTLIQ